MNSSVSSETIGNIYIYKACEVIRLIKKKKIWEVRDINHSIFSVFNLITVLEIIWDIKGISYSFICECKIIIRRRPVGRVGCRYRERDSSAREENKNTHHSTAPHCTMSDMVLLLLLCYCTLCCPGSVMQHHWKHMQCNTEVTEANQVNSGLSSPEALPAHSRPSC